MYINPKMIVGIDARPLQTTNRSGIPNYVAHLVTALIEVDKHNEYRLFYNGVQDIAPYILEPLKTNMQQGRIQSKGFRIPNKILENLWNTIKLPPIETFLGNLDVFHATNYTIPPVRRAKLVVTIHDLSFIKHPEFFTNDQGTQFAKRVKYACNKADVIISDSWSTRADLIEELNISPEKVIVIPLAAQQEHRNVTALTDSSVLTQKYHLSGKYILFVGTIEPRKNLVRLIQAYDNLPSTIKAEYQLILAGGKGWLNEDVYEEAEKRGLIEKGIRFLGYVPDKDLPILFSNATVFVYPSLYEGFGLPPLEAMACGTPVVSSKASSIPEVVGDAGILIDPYSVEELSASIEKVIEDEVLAKKMIDLGFARASMFSWRKTASETIKVYQQVCNK